MANGRPTPYPAFGAFYARLKEVIDNHGWHPFQARTLGRRDKKLSLLILNPNLRGADEPSAREIGKAKRAALKVVHTDLLTGSPDLTSADPAGRKTCLESGCEPVWQLTG